MSIGSEPPRNEGRPSREPQEAGANPQQPKLLADDRRLNWSALVAVCVATGVVAAGIVGMFVVRAMSPGPLGEALQGASKPGPLDEQPVQLAPTSGLRTTSWALLPASRVGAVDDAPGAVLPTNQVDVVPETNADARQPEIEVNPVVGVVVVAAPTATNEQTSGGAATAEPASVDRASAAPSQPTGGATAVPSTLPNAETDVAETEPTEPPPGASLGYTYCGAVTCGVGFSCCCDVCVPAGVECEPASCQAHSGLSISVPCGMDLCDSGEVCCDPRCGACARAGECPEDPCG